MSLPEGLLDGLAVREFTLGGVRFSVRKMAPLTGWATLEKIRPHIGPLSAALATAVDVDPTDAMHAAIASLAQLPPAVLVEVRDDLFREITFRDEEAAPGAGKQPGPLPLSGNEGLAFARLEPGDVYEVIVRGLAVNFSRSFAGLISRFRAAEEPATARSSTRPSLPGSRTSSSPGTSDSPI